VQDAYIRAYRAFGTFRGESKLSTYSRRASTNCPTALTRDIDLTMEDAFGFDGARCNRIVAGVLEAPNNLVTSAETRS